MCAMILDKPSLQQMQLVLSSLLRESDAKAAVLVDQDGRSIAEKGFTKNLDIDALSALVAGSFASTQALAKLVGETEFTVMFHQGAKGRSGSKRAAARTRPSSASWTASSAAPGSLSMR